MKLKLTSIFDAKLAIFGPPQIALTEAAAIRQFSDDVNNAQGNLSKHPEDYSLWYIGDYDDETASFSQAVPKNLVTASALKSVMSPDDQLDLFKNGKQKAPVN